ncbi:MAG TPA: hypothetical protein PKE29_15920 [Phycisphaerales bacterium]|mgnify:CR=1 FL=1|nr:hypothetical protein [Phycisphaerales bacterium]
MQRVLAVLVIGCLASSVVAQPTRTTAAGGIEALLPKAVVIDDHGEVVVESAWVLLAPGVTLESARLSTIPIESVVQGGARKPGVIVCNRSESETGRIEFRQPEVVRLSADGAYKAEYGTHFLGGGPSRFPAGWTDVLSTPRTCPVKYDASPLGALPVPRAPGFSIQWMFPDDTVGGPLFPPALGHPPAERYARVKDAIMRGGKYVARALQNSTGTMMVQVRFEAPSGATNASASCVPMVVNPSVSLLRNRLLVEIAGSTSGLEANYEDLLTNELPPSSVPFVWDTTTRSATSLWVHAALAIHLQGIYGSGGGLPGTPPNTHAVVRVRPETGPDATTLRWQVYAAKCGATSTGTGYVRNMLDVTIAHEIIHGLGFLSSGDNLIEPTTAIEEWDAFRVPISLANATGGPGGNFRPAVRELRPGQQAVGIVSLNNAGWSQKLSQGTRIGGDTYQASHWKHKYLLPTGSSAIGIMDPVGEEFACEVSKTPGPSHYRARTTR